MKSVKEKIYHKLINNEISYNTRSIRRYKKNNTKIIGNSKKDKIPQLEKLKKQINSIKN